MKFFKRNGFLSVFIALIVAFVVGILLNITHNTKSISENEIRSHLEQMYDAEVAGVSMKQDVYKAVITKSGAFYLVEMNAVTGDVYSLEQTNEFDLDKQGSGSIDSEGVVEENTLEFLEQPLLESSGETNSTAKVETVKPPTKIVITEKPKNTITKLETTNTQKSTVVVSPKGVKSAQTKVEEKLTEEKQNKEEKPMKEVIKDALKPESSKTEEEKEDVSKVEQTKTEVAKTEIVKEESPLSETSKPEDAKAEEQQTTPIKPLAIQLDAKKPDADSKTDKAPTVLISEEQAIKTAQQQIKGTVESNSFVKTNEGGYYLIVMKASLSDSDSKEGSKTKQSKATIQVHAISGKILSVTWE